MVKLYGTERNNDIFTYSFTFQITRHRKLTATDKRITFSVYLVHVVYCAYNCTRLFLLYWYNVTLLWFPWYSWISLLAHRKARQLLELHLLSIRITMKENQSQGHVDIYIVKVGKTKLHNRPQVWHSTAWHLPDNI